MNTIIANTDTAIRRAAAPDFFYIRQLPVAMTQPPASALSLKQLRMMMQVRDHELIVLENDRRIAAFMALQYQPAPDAALRFLVIRYFAIDRFALRQGLAAEMEAHAAAKARASDCAALLVRAAKLNGPALQFYEEHGYVANGDMLLKHL